MMNRKYVGVPTQVEITEQFNTLRDLVCGIGTIEQIRVFSAEHKEIEVEVNYDELGNYKEKDGIDVIRYEYKNILVYFNVDAEGRIFVDEFITVYTDDGEQLGDAKYDEYDAEIERIAKMGLLTKTDNVGN